MKNLQDYTLDQLKNIADQLMIPKNEVSQAKKATIIGKINAKAEEISQAIPEPESIVDVVVSQEEKEAQPMRIQDYPRRRVVVESRDSQWKSKVFGVNTYQANVPFGQPVSLPLPVIDYIKTLKDTVHTVDSEGNSKREFRPRFFITEPDDTEE